MTVSRLALVFLPGPARCFSTATGAVGCSTQSLGELLFTGAKISQIRFFFSFFFKRGAYLRAFFKID